MLLLWCFSQTVWNCLLFYKYTIPASLRTDISLFFRRGRLSISSVATRVVKWYSNSDDTALSIPADMFTFGFVQSGFSIAWHAFISELRHSICFFKAVTFFILFYSLTCLSVCIRSFDLNLVRLIVFPVVFFTLSVKGLGPSTLSIDGLSSGLCPNRDSLHMYFLIRSLLFLLLSHPKPLVIVLLLCRIDIIWNDIFFSV